MEDLPDPRGVPTSVRLLDSDIQVNVEAPDKKDVMMEKEKEPSSEVPDDLPNENTSSN